MNLLIDPDFRNVAVIKTRPGIMPNKVMIDGLCWMCATADGCEGNCSPHGYHYDYYTCPSCRRMVPWSSGGTDSLDCADCWALTEERKTMEEKNEETAAPVPKRQFVKWTCLLRAFDRDGGEIKNGANEDAMTAAWSLEEVIKNSPSSSVMLVRNDIGKDGQLRGDVVTVVALRHDATPIEVVTTLQRAIDVTLGRSAMNPKANDDGQIADKVRSQTIQAVKSPSQTQEAAAKIRAQQEPACGVAAYDVGTIRSDKPSTKALEKIIKRQEKRIEDLARKNGNLECVVTSYEPFHNRLLAATNAKALSEAVAVAEQVISEYCKSRIVPVANKD